MKRGILLATFTLLASGCASLPTYSLPGLLAAAAWKDRPLRDVVEHFGVPGDILMSADDQRVVLVYSENTSFSRYQAVGSHTGVQSGQIVRTEYWGNVIYPANCEIRIGINRARTVEHYALRGRNCGALKLMPARKS